MIIVHTSLAVASRRQQSRPFVTSIAAAAAAACGVCSQLLLVTSPAVGGHAVLVHDVIDRQRVPRVPVTLEDGRQLSLKRLAGTRYDVIIG